MNSIADARACIRGMNSGQVCRVTNQRNGMVSPVLAPDELTAKVTEVLKQAKTKSLADQARAVVNVLYRDRHPQSCAGKSLLEMMWDELDAIMGRLMDDATEEDVGQARGVAYCIAMVQNPYRPNIEAVKEQAMERWEGNANG